MKTLRESTYFHIFLVLVTVTIVGTVITNDYGISWDEPFDIAYGIESLRAYYSEPTWQWTSPAGPTGPLSFMLTEISAHVFRLFVPTWMLTDARHFTYFVMFQVAAISLYWLCLRVSNKRAALLATLLFITQPLLFGHAFINPKDIPFMAFFSASIASGLAMVNAHVNSDVSTVRMGPGMEGERVWTALWRIWKGMSKKEKGLLFTLSILSLLGIVDILVLNQVILPRLTALVYHAYHNSSIELINSLFQNIAESADQIEVTSYIWKVTRAYWFLRIPLSIGILFSLVLILRKRFRLPYLTIASEKNSFLILAGILLGLTTSIRVVAPFAGLLVSIFLIAKRGLKGFKPLIFYWFLAVIISFITRPYFWQNSVDRVWKSMISASNFHSTSSVFFQGNTYSTTNLPLSFSPAFLLRQLTEPLLLLIVLGVVIVVVRTMRGDADRMLVALVLGWFLVPIAMLRITNVVPYNNFRQFLFLIPALFIFASVGIDYFLSKVGNNFLLSIIVAMIFLPGITSIIRLHPYEYIYHNSLAGGYGELDYWCTSYRTAMDYINTAAPEGSTIAVAKPINIARPFAREDLRLIELDEEIYVDVADYALLCGEYMDTYDLSKFETVWEVSREGKPLAVVKRID